MAKIRVRARAVDMLGRQQIAGIPTAIHELFKNAHDAYAANVEVDFFRSERVLVLRDNGTGMTPEDFESRWLTLGTESKVGANEDRDIPWLAQERGGRRPILGEKGIGRLAIAAIGPAVLVMTRAIREGGRLSDLVVALVHWSLFEIPGVDLDQIDVPIVVLPGGQLPSKDDVHALTGRIRVNIETLGQRIDRKTKTRLVQELEALNLDPVSADSVLGQPSVAGQGHGTHFYISPTYSVLENDIDDISEDVASPLQKMLLGFTNTMMPNRPQPPIRALFRDHRADGTVNELIAGNSFFTPEEFKSADHHFTGDFDEFGQFVGLVSVYGKEPVRHTITWPGARNRKTECGPFRLSIAYVQGRASESKLPAEDFALINVKLNKIGGLYIYRDGNRVLPYGNSDFDFLNIERRRTKSAQDWFFSYRRMFGAVDISYASNPDLVEKAGREGFRANVAHRQFTNILESFFKTLALDFFRETGRYSDEYLATKEELTEQDRLLKRREKSTREKKQRFATSIDGFFQSIERQEPQMLANQLREEISSRVSALETLSDRTQAANELLRIESDIRNRLAGIRSQYRLSRPSGVGLNKAMAADWQAYSRIAAQLETDVVEPLARHLNGLITDAAHSERISLDRRRRIESALEQESKAATNNALDLRRQCGQFADELADTLRNDLRTRLTRLESEIRDVAADFQRSDVANISRSQLESLQRLLSTRINNAGESCSRHLEKLREQLRSQIDAVREEVSLDDVTAAVEEKSEAYREELDVYIEWAQVGMALGVIQHEFASTITAVSGSIRRLKPWAEGTTELKPIYQSLRTGFEHLDAYLALFTPLRKRLHRKKVPLSGEEIRRYLLEIFGSRLERHHVTLKWTTEFDKKTVEVFPSTLLPTFVNVVDNAIYWLDQSGTPAKEICLDADQTAFFIENNGPGIEARIVDRVFEFGFSRKANGRGMGLFISREALRRDGFDLTVDPAGPLNHPRFRVQLTHSLAEKTSE